jgi:CHAT domain-containing protein
LVFKNLVNKLLALTDEEAQHQLLRDTLDKLNDDEIETLCQSLKEKAFHFIWSETQNALHIADLILYLSKLTNNDLHRALGMRIKAQALSLGMGDYQKSLAYYEEATKIYRERGDIVRQARVNVTRIWALTNLGHYDEAFRAGKWASKILYQHSQWLSLATLHNNLALAHNRRGEFSHALAMFNEANRAYRQLGRAGEPFLPNNELNRALALRNVGRFQESIETSQVAIALSKKLGQTTVTARAQHNLGSTYLLLGNHIEAMRLFDRAQDTHLENEQPHEAALCELSIVNSLLEIRKFDIVLKKCERLFDIFCDLGMRLESAAVLRNQAKAYNGMNNYEEAINSLIAARLLFEGEENRYELARTQLAISSLLHLNGQFAESQATAKICASYFNEVNLPIEATQANMIYARSAFALNDFDLAHTCSMDVLAFAEHKGLSYLTYQGYQLLGELAQKDGEINLALDYFDRSLTELERLRGNVMTEFQAGFLEGEENAYENVIGIFLDQGQPEQSLEYVERAKSRALQDLLAFRIDLGFQARQEGDKSLVAELDRLRSDREQLLRYGETVGGIETEVDQLQIQQKVLEVEKEITNLWHKLLVRNADYARDASLWQVRIEAVQPYLDAQTLLLEYFAVRGELVLFLVNNGISGVDETVRAFRLPVKITQVEQTLQLFGLNLRAVPQSSDTYMVNLEANARGILYQLYQWLIEPVSNLLAKYKRIIIVPHGPLHYLPFHALYDGNAYLIQKYQFSYLPAASILRYAREGKTGGEEMLAVGHSHNGLLPHTVEEANMVAEVMGAKTLLEKDANCAMIQAMIPDCRLLHIAGHGDFRPDNPLFSGLALSDGWITTLDIFNLRLQASLVVLSACQTGRSIVGGGDELFGLMRAFISAGVASLVLSLWAVADQSTSQLMRIFYQNIAAGEEKGTALRKAQCSLLQPVSAEANVYTHPYFWAPFFLVGDDGKF